MSDTEASRGLSERWIRFQGNVYDNTSQALTQVVDQCLNSGVERIHLMITSPGGVVYYGANLFSYLRRLPIKISTYNVSTVQSIGVSLFCAGVERHCVPEATFMIHPVLIQPTQNLFLNAQQFQGLADSCTVQTRSLANIIAGATGKPIDHVLEDMNRTTWLDAEQSKAYGLVNTVTTDLLPPGVELTAIYEDGTVRVYPATQQGPSLAEVLAQGRIKVAAMPGLPRELPPAGSN